jgi:hypothetical protein
MALGLTQPLTEMSTRNLPGGKGQLVREAICLENVGSSTSHNPMGLHGLFLYVLIKFSFTGKVLCNL